MGANSILYIDKTLTNGNTVISEVATTRPTLATGAKIYMPENLSDGQTLVLFDEEADNSLADDSDTITETNAAIQDNALIDYVAASSSDNLVVTANAKAEVTSQAIIIKPFLYEEPFIPIRCSVEILVSNMEPAITTPVKLLPPKKYPS